VSTVTQILALAATYMDPADLPVPRRRTPEPYDEEAAARIRAERAARKAANFAKRRGKS
jgi:hypothetical protein